MEDTFADPRTRSSRSRGRGRGGRGRARGRGRGTGRIPPQRRFQDDNLGSNAYRFKEEEEEQDEDVNYDAGLDFEEAAQAMDYQDSEEIDDVKKANGMGFLALDFSNLAKVMGSVPLWVRLGEQSRDALGVSKEASIYDFLESSEDEEKVSSPKQDSVIDRLLEDVNTLSLDGDTSLKQTDPAVVSDSKHDDNMLDKEHKQPNVVNEELQEHDEPDDFDKWLDGV